MRLNRWKWLLEENGGGGTEGPGGPLADWIDWMLDRFLAERDEEWPDDPTLEELATLLGNVTRSLADAPSDGAYDSARPMCWQGQEELPWPRISRLPNGDVFQRQLRETTEVELVGGMAEGLSEAADRAQRLAQRILQRRPGQPVTTFLARVGRCYISGLLPECVLLCRTALESATIQTAGGEGLPSDRAAGASTPERLRALRQAGALSEEGLHTAQAVWGHTERVLHGESHEGDEVLESIIRTSEVLTELHPHE